MKKQRQSIQTMCMAAIILMGMTSSVLSTEIPCLYFQKTGRYSIHADISKWTKVSLNLWKSKGYSFSVNNQSAIYDIYGFKADKNRLMLPIKQSNYYGLQIPIYIESQSPPGNLHFRFQEKISYVSTFIPFHKDMFSLNGIAPDLIAYVSDIARPHLFLSFTPNGVSLQAIEQSKHRYGFTFHHSKTYEIKGKIQSNEWKTLQTNPNIHYARLYTFLINNTPYKGFRHTSGKYLLDVQNQNIQKHQGAGITICIETNHSPGTLRYHSKFEANIDKKFKSITKNDFLFVDHPNYKVEDILFDYIPDSPSLLLKITHTPAHVKLKNDNQYHSVQTTQTKAKPVPDIWNQIDETNFDVNEYKNLPEIYEINIQNGFYCSVQDFTYDHSKKKRLQNSAWKNFYERIPIINEIDPFENSFYMKVTSEHQMNHHKKIFFIIKALNSPLDLIHANRKVHHFNNIKYADQKNWKIPTIQELTHIFQFKEYRESISNLVKTFMPPYRSDERISFWTSTFQNRNQKKLWTLRFQYIDEGFAPHQFQKMAYDIKYSPIQSTGKAYLLPISVQL